MTGIGTGGIGQKQTAGGGITPEQTALAQYHFGQGAIKSMSDFAGLPVSTGMTQAIGGARAGAAKEAGEQSQVNAAAMTNFLNQQTANLTSGIGGLLGGLSGGGKGGGGGGGGGGTGGGG